MTIYNVIAALMGAGAGYLIGSYTKKYHPEKFLMVVRVGVITAIIAATGLVYYYVAN